MDLEAKGSFDFDLPLNTAVTTTVRGNGTQEVAFKAKENSGCCGKGWFFTPTAKLETGSFSSWQVESGYATGDYNARANVTSDAQSFSFATRST